jgi:hypothetical protein
MQPAGFEPTISANEWSQTQAFGRAATGIGNYLPILDNNANQATPMRQFDVVSKN